MAIEPVGRCDVMNLEEVLGQLQSLGDPANVEGMERFGIWVRKALGVPTSDLRRLARQIWQTQPGFEPTGHPDGQSHSGFELEVGTLDCGRRLAGADQRGGSSAIATVRPT